MGNVSESLVACRPVALERRPAISTILCPNAKRHAIWERFPDQLEQLKQTAPKLTHDWGSQFTSRRYQNELRTLGITDRPTMIASPEQNDIQERFFGALKDEDVWPNEYDTRADAITAINAWINFYRTERPNQALGYLTPTENHAQTRATPGSTIATLAA